MSLSDANVIQENSGTSSSTTNHVVSLGSGTTAGNTLIVVTYSSGALTAPSGFSADAGTGAADSITIWRKSDVPASETSWTFTTVGATSINWQVTEYSNMDLVEPADVSTSGSSASLANNGTLSTGTTARNAGLSVVVIAAFSTLKASGTPTWSGYTNNFEEIADVSSSLAALGVAREFQDGTTSTFECTATLSRSDAANTAKSRIVAYRAADVSLAAPLASFVGFEWGTHGGMGNTGAGNPMGSAFGASGTWGTNYLVQSSSARSSGYGARVAPSASTAYIPMATLSSAGAAACGLNCRVVSGSGVVVVAVLLASTSLQLVYDTSTNKFGLRWGAGGTASYQSGTTATNTWVWVDIRAKINSATWHADWRIETGTDTYTDQTSPADLTGQTPGTFTASPPMTLGNSAATQTMTADYDDAILSRYYAAYPLGPHRVDGLTVDTGGTPTVSGTTTNFNVFTANGTLAAWNATNARNAVDDVPPTISASADGVVQVTTAASDYMEFPMANPSLASNEVIGGVRSVIPLWGGTGTGTGTLGLRVSDGTTETTVDAGSSAYDADSLTAASSSYPLWRQAMIPAPAGGWTPTTVNALVTRVGYSSDATPDMGVHALYCEVATRKAIDTVVHRLEDDLARTTLRVNPYNSSAVSYVTVNNDTNSRACMFRYWVGGVEQDPPVGAGGSRANVAAGGSQTVTINADAFGDVDQTLLQWV